MAKKSRTSKSRVSSRKKVSRRPSSRKNSQGIEQRLRATLKKLGSANKAFQSMKNRLNKQIKLLESKVSQFVRREKIAKQVSAKIHNIFHKAPSVKKSARRSSGYKARRNIRKAA